MSVLVSLVLASALTAQDPAPSTAFADVLACRTLTDTTQRLACFDRTTAALNAAQASGQVAVIDRQQFDATQREAFGFGVPSLGRLFGGDDRSALDQIETTLESAVQTRGGWVFRLADGSVWRQVDGQTRHVRNRQGDPVRVRRGALGNFIISVGSTSGISVRRE